ncbi:MAG: hypothetical protein R2810_04160 [Flavobacteriales bacterium]
MYGPWTAWHRWLVHQDIRAIVLNQRKLALVQGMHDDLFEKALTNGEIGTP